VSPRVNNVHHDDASLILHATGSSEPEADASAPPQPPEQESLF